MLVRIVKGWKGPDFFYQTPGEKGIWDGIRFTFDPVEECDLLIMLNNEMKTDVTVRCPRENVWAIMQEPYRRGHTDWMVEGHEAFTRVFTHHIPSGDPKYVRSHPADPWHVNKNFDELITATVPRKTGAISWIAGNATDLPGHMVRFRFLDFVKRNDPIGIDYYGRAVRFIEDKWDGLAPYRYTIIVQNSVSPDYWTDVVEDTFLAGTVPLYCGCTNLEDYFPEEAFIRIDISRPEESLETIVKTVREDKWEKRLTALEEARRRVLLRHQFFPHLSRLIRTLAVEGKEKVPVRIPAYKRSAVAKLCRIEFKVERMVGKWLHRGVIRR
jgi:hypothetical protein